MDFVAKEIFYLFWFSLTLGAFGTITQYPFNKVAVDGATNQDIKCKSSSNANPIKWSFTHVESEDAKVIRNGDSNTDDAYSGELDGKWNNLFIKTVSSSTAGTYTCEETDTRSAVLIVLTSDPSCDYTPRETKALPCDSTLTLSCTVSYIADSTVVTPHLIWSKIIDTATSADNVAGTSYPEGQQTPPSKSGIITTTTSTLNVKLPTDGGKMPTYQCDATFNVTQSAKWPTMSQKAPPDSHKCQLFASASSVPCGGKDPGDDTKKSEIGGNSSVRSAETNNLAIRVLGVAGVLLLAQVL